MRKGQTAMEYLMTYGWALIIIAIVIAALWALGVFKLGAPTGATGFQKFYVPGFQYSDTTFQFTLRNLTGTNVTLNSVTATSGTTTVTCTLGSTTLGAGGETQATCSGMPSCSSGSSYSVSVEINYTQAGYYYMDKGTISGTCV